MTLEDMEKSPAIPKYLESQCAAMNVEGSRVIVITELKARKIRTNAHFDPTFRRKPRLARQSIPVRPDLTTPARAT